MLGTIKFVDKSVNVNSARRLDNCDIIASRSGFGVRIGVLHSSGFDCIIRPAPSGAGRTTPSQPGHYPLSMPSAESEYHIYKKII